MLIMRVWLAFLATASLCSWTWAAQAADISRPPVAAFGTVPAINDLSISPNGQLLAWIDNSGTTPAVEVFNLDKNATVLRMAPDGVKLRTIHWADDEILLYSVSFTRRTQLGNGAMSEPIEWLRTTALNVQTRKNVILLSDREEFSYVSGARLRAPRTATPKKVLMESWFFSMANYREQTGSRLGSGRKDEAGPTTSSRSIPRLARAAWCARARPTRLIGCSIATANRSRVWNGIRMASASRFCIDKARAGPRYSSSPPASGRSFAARPTTDRC